MSLRTYRGCKDVKSALAANQDPTFLKHPSDLLYKFFREQERKTYIPIEDFFSPDSRELRGPYRKIELYLDRSLISKIEMTLGAFGVNRMGQDIERVMRLIVGHGIRLAPIVALNINGYRYIRKRFNTATMKIE